VRTANAVLAARRIDGEVHVTERPGHARELAAAAARRGDRLVIAWGGDGTINEVASALAFGGPALGMVAAGSGNGLARELGVPRRAEDAIGHALDAVPRAIDVGAIGDRLFVNLAGIGVDAHVASQFNRPGHRRGFLGYIGITIRTLREYVPVRYRITAPNCTIETRAVLVTLANSAQFGNGARIAPGARVDDGLLDLVVVEERSRMRTIFSVPRLFNDTVARIPGCRIEKIREATIEADQPMTFQVDGEPVDGGTSLHARVHPGALRIAL